MRKNFGYPKTKTDKDQGPIGKLLNDPKYKHLLQEKPKALASNTQTQHPNNSNCARPAQLMQTVGHPFSLQPVQFNMIGNEHSKKEQSNPINLINPINPNNLINPNNPMNPIRNYEKEQRNRGGDLLFQPPNHNLGQEQQQNQGQYFEHHQSRQEVEPKVGGLANQRLVENIIDNNLNCQSGPPEPMNQPCQIFQPPEQGRVLSQDDLYQMNQRLGQIQHQVNQYLEEKRQELEGQKQKNYNKDIFPSFRNQRPFKNHYPNQIYIKFEVPQCNSQRQNKLFNRQMQFKPINFEEMSNKMLQNLKRKKYNKRLNSQTVIPVREFGGVCTIHYQILIKWREQIKSKPRAQFRGKVQVSTPPLTHEIIQALTKDLSLKGHQLPQPISPQSISIDIKEQGWIDWLMRKTKKQEYSVKASIIENKIVVPQGYCYGPSTFEGFIVQNLSIYNQYGSITWPSKSNVAGIDFCKGLKIQKYGVECYIPELQKEAIVMLKNVPTHIDLKNRKKQLQKLCRSRNCELIEVGEEYWKIKVDFSK